MTELILDLLERRTGNGLRDAAGDADKLADSLGRTHNPARQFNDDMEVARKRVHDLSAEWARTGGQDSGLTKDLRKARAELGEFERVAKTLVPVMEDVGRESAKAISSGLSGAAGTPGVGPILIGILVGAGLYAAPLIGASIAGAVTTAVGGSAVALGIAAAAQDSRVKAAAGEVWHSIGAEFARDGDVLVGPVLNSLGILRQAFSNLHLEKAFATVAPLVERIAHGISGFAFQFGDQFNQAITAAMPALSAFADALPLVGFALGAMFHRIAESRGTVSGIIFLMQEFSAVLMGVGNAIGWLADRFGDLVELGAEFGLVLRAIGLGNLADQADQLAAAQNQLGEATAAAGYAAVASQVYLGDLASAYTSTTMSVEGLKQALDDLFDQQMSVDQAALQTKTDMLAFRAAVEANGTSLSNFTQTGLANQNMLLGLIKDYEATRDASIKAGGGTAAATRKFDDQVASLVALAGKLGFTKSQVQQLLGPYMKLHDAPDIDKEIRVHINVFGAGSLAVLGKAQYSFADGGWVPGAPGQAVPAIVHGGEFVVSRDMLAGRATAPASVGGGSSVGPRTAPINLSGSGLGQVVMAWLRYEVQTQYGGDVVAAFN